MKANQIIPRTERCTNELPATSNSANCDAITCNALATYITEDGPRCASCYREFGGMLVIDADEPEQHEVSPLWIRANTAAATELERRRTIRDLGTLMSGVIDQMTKGGTL